jgi:hypothetical protein
MIHECARAQNVTSIDLEGSQSKMVVDIGVWYLHERTRPKSSITFTIYNHLSTCVMARTLFWPSSGTNNFLLCAHMI